MEYEAPPPPPVPPQLEISPPIDDGVFYRDQV